MRFAKEMSYRKMQKVYLRAHCSNFAQLLLIFE